MNYHQLQNGVNLCYACPICGGPAGAWESTAYLPIAVYPLAFALFPPGSLRGGNAGDG